MKYNGSLPDFDEALRMAREQFPHATPEELAVQVADLLIALEPKRKRPANETGQQRKRNRA